MRQPMSGAQVFRVARRPGTRHGGLIVWGSLVLPCQLGAGGITRLKREGDGATPAGPLRLISLMYRADRLRRPGGGFASLAEPLRRRDLWCDDVRDGRYNRLVEPPFKASHEVMWRDDHLYDVVGVLDWNIWPRSIGRGSAIFLHVARPDLGPTAGCIALTLADMRKLLARLWVSAVFEVV